MQGYVPYTYFNIFYLVQCILLSSLYIFVSTEEQLEPGPDGKLISTQERLQHVQQHQRGDDSVPTVEVSEDGRAVCSNVQSISVRKQVSKHMFFHVLFVKRVDSIMYLGSRLNETYL